MLINPATNHDNTQNTSFENCPNHIVEHANISNYLFKNFFPAKKLTYVCQAFRKDRYGQFIVSGCGIMALCIFAMTFHKNESRFTYNL